MILTILGTLGIVAALVGAGVLIDRRWSLLPRREELIEASRPKPLGAGHAPGTAPQVAIGADPARRRRVVDRQRCACGEPMAAAGEDAVRFEGKRLEVVRVRCAACGATRSLYFEPRG